MLKLSANLRNLNVVSLRSGATVAIAVQPIINPHNLKILGWWCKSPMSPNQLVLLSDDVREQQAGGLIINDEEDLTAAEDLARHKKILDIDFELIGKLVKTKRSKLGKVSDFSYNDGMLVQKMYVERPLTKVFSTEATLLIDRSQIIEVTDNYILVKDSDVKATEAEFAGATAPV
ncbi:MAG TPA: hypothetical protein VMT23_03160 [Candidatus Binatia bacterium]|nr:hypothetical protein [Candidatus Binatia bacterium]